MNRMDIIDALSSDTGLLVRSDAWLEVRKTKVCQDIDLLLEDLKQIQAALKIKRELQQKNLVAVQRSKFSSPMDRAVEILPLSDAVRSIPPPERNQILNIWNSDGYDIAACMQL
jgi:hypothetical protein